MESIAGLLYDFTLWLFAIAAGNISDRGDERRWQAVGQTPAVGHGAAEGTDASMTKRSSLELSGGTKAVHQPSGSMFTAMRDVRSGNRPGKF